MGRGVKPQLGPEHDIDHLIGWQDRGTVLAHDAEDTL